MLAGHAQHVAFCSKAGRKKPLWAQRKRSYRWLIEGDTDEHGYDHTGDVACIWIYLRAGLERGDF